MHRSLSDGQGWGSASWTCTEHRLWKQVCMGLGVKHKVGVLPVWPDTGWSATFSSVSYTPSSLVPLLFLRKTLFLHHSSLRRSHGSTLISFQSWPGLILSERSFLTTLSKVGPWRYPASYSYFFCLELTLGVYRVFVYCVSPIMKRTLPEDLDCECLQQCLA